jgi:hypothetical protein
MRHLRSRWAGADGDAGAVELVEASVPETHRHRAFEQEEVG